MTMKETAAHLGVTYTVVWNEKRRSGLSFVRGNQTAEFRARMAESMAERLKCDEYRARREKWLAEGRAERLRNLGFPEMKRRGIVDDYRALKRRGFTAHEARRILGVRAHG